MEWALHDHQGNHRRREPRLELLKVYWRMVGPSKKPITCGLYRTDAGLEVRAERSADDLLYSTLAATELDGEARAAAWKEAVEAKGGFVEVPDR